jgi:hypothetical protein
VHDQQGDIQSSEIDEGASLPRHMFDMIAQAFRRRMK